MNRLFKILSLTIFAAAFVVAAAEQKTEIKISGMSCESCAKKVETTLKDIKGVKSADVSLDEEKAVVEFDADKLSKEELYEVINKAGYKAVKDEKDNQADSGT